MTHGEIYTKYKVEYDKEVTISSYPNLTDQEIKIILDKAYLAIIAQKLTGNNPRNIGFEEDNKAIEDIRPLIETDTLFKIPRPNWLFAKNAVVYNIDENSFLYYIQGNLKVDYKIEDVSTGVIVEEKDASVNVKLVTHETALKYMQTINNVPWIEQPVCYIEGDNLIVLIDPFRHTAKELFLTYIKKPQMFSNSTDETVFELSDTMVEELINLAIIMTAETVESPRLTTKQNIRPLES